MLNYNKLIFKGNTLSLILNFLDINYSLELIISRSLNNEKYFEDILRLIPSIIEVNNIRLKLFNMFYNSYQYRNYVYTNALNYLTYLKFYLLSTSSILLNLNKMYLSNILNYFNIVKMLIPICIANLISKILLINYRIVNKESDLNYYMQSEDVWLPEDLFLRMIKIVNYRSMLVDSNKQNILNVFDNYKPWQIRYILSTLGYEKVIFNSWPNGFYLCNMYTTYIKSLLYNNLDKYLLNYSKIILKK